MFCFGTDMTLFLDTDNLLSEGLQTLSARGVKIPVLYEKLNEVCVRIASVPRYVLPNQAFISGEVLPSVMGTLCKSALDKMTEVSAISNTASFFAPNLSPTCFASSTDSASVNLSKVSTGLYLPTAFNCPIRLYSRLENNKPEYISKEYEATCLHSLHKSLCGTITGRVGGKDVVALFPKNSILVADWIKDENQVLRKRETITRLLDIFLNIPYTYLFESSLLVRRRNIPGTMFCSGCSNFYEQGGVGILEYLPIPINAHINEIISTLVFSQIKLALKVMEDESLTDRIFVQFTDELLVRGLDLMDAEYLEKCKNMFIGLMRALGKDYADIYNLANLDNLVCWLTAKKNTSALSSADTPNEKISGVFERSVNPTPLYAAQSDRLFTYRKAEIDRAVSYVKTIREKELFIKSSQA